jgi:hypothetical protein
MYVMAAIARHAMRVHRALHEIVPLHPILMRRAVREVRERCSPSLNSSSFQKFFKSIPTWKPTGQSQYFPLIGFVTGCPCEWHWMQTFVACIESSRDGFTIFVCEGFATCADPGPWHFSQPTFHSDTAFV